MQGNWSIKVVREESTSSSLSWLMSRLVLRGAKSQWRGEGRGGEGRRRKSEGDELVRGTIGAIIVVESTSEGSPAIHCSKYKRQSWVECVCIYVSYVCIVYLSVTSSTCVYAWLGMRAWRHVFSSLGRHVERTLPASCSRCCSSLTFFFLLPAFFE